MERLEVIADFNWLEGEETIGYLNYEQLSGENIYSFEYERTWCKAHPNILLGADLQPFSGRMWADGNFLRIRWLNCVASELPRRK